MIFLTSRCRRRRRRCLFDGKQRRSDVGLTAQGEARILRQVRQERVIVGSVYRRRQVGEIILQSHLWQVKERLLLVVAIVDHRCRTESGRAAILNFCCRRCRCRCR